jgi:hypothetical protein
MVQKDKKILTGDFPFTIVFFVINRPNDEGKISKHNRHYWDNRDTPYNPVVDTGDKDPKTTEPDNALVF